MTTSGLEGPEGEAAEAEGVTPFAVGIDLGTTHTALSFIRLTGGTEDAAVPVSPASSVSMEIPQIVRPGEVAESVLLPSFLYRPHPSEAADGALALPWDAKAKDAVGEWARSKGALTPARLVSSAKSWLCHPTLDRRSAFLPPGAPEDVEKISPLAASARYLAHLRAAWDHRFAAGAPEMALERQTLTLTVPASFDAVARALTVEAAQLAGLKNVTLLEEPQAALYAWVESLGDAWRKQVAPGDVILVCDVGGGTTDFSLIQVGEDGGNLSLSRLAVGSHILLGGDNMDLALAVALQRQLLQEGKKLDRWQLVALTHSVRLAKERMLSDAKLDSVSVTVPSRGSGLVGGGLKAVLKRELLTRVLVEGFFPVVPVEAVPNAPRRIGLTAIGLPYASDAAVTRHLADFLTRHASASGVPGRSFVHPTAVLFNGGVMKARELRERFMSVLSGWVKADGGAAPRELRGGDLDLAVSRGAAVFGRVRQGSGIRIRGGTARAYYVGIETSMPAVPGLPPPMKALCLAPMGMEEGTSVELPGEDLGLVVGEPAQFKLFGSTVRRGDKVGDEVEDIEELEELPPMETSLPAGEGRGRGDVVPVRLKARVTEIGTLELFCAGTGKDGGLWKLEFDLRGNDGVEIDLSDLEVL